MTDSPNSPALQSLCDELAAVADGSVWPAKALQRCAEAGFYRWFVCEEDGGFGFSSAEIATGYLALSKANLTVTFILTQRVAALRRIAGCENEALKRRLLPRLLSGEQSATVGISHLTTSRRHLKAPILSMVSDDFGFVANGTSPWATGAGGADWVLLGGSMVDDSGEADGREVLFLAPTDDEQLTVKEGFDLIALSPSQTGAVVVQDLTVPPENVVAGPVEQVLTGNGGGAGGLQTSVLALGLSSAAIEYIEAEAILRGELIESAQSLRQQFDDLKTDLFAAAEGDASLSAGEIRSRSNSLALRATQSALGVAKGAGFVSGHRVGRWCQEALFFLVWSCPQEVLQSNLDEFAFNP